MNSAGLPAGDLEIIRTLPSTISHGLLKPTQLPTDLEWVNDLLNTLHRAARRIYPKVVLDELDTYYLVKFYHLLQFSQDEKSWIKTIIEEVSKQEGVKVTHIGTTKDWVSFRVKKSGAAGHKPAMSVSARSDSNP